MVETRNPLGHDKKPGYPGRRDMEQVEVSTERLRHSPQTNKQLLTAVSQRLEKLATSPETPSRSVRRRHFLHPSSQGEIKSHTHSPSPGHSPRLRLGSFGTDHRGSPAYVCSPGHRHGSDLDLGTSPSPSHTPGHHIPECLSPNHRHGSDNDLHGLRSPCRSPRHRHGSDLDGRRQGWRLHRPPMLKRIDELRRGSLTGSLPDLREAGTLDYLQTVFREAMAGHPVAPVPPIPQGSDIFREAMLDMRPPEEDSDHEDVSTILREENCCQRAPVCKYMNKHGPRRPGTLLGIATNSTTYSPRHGKRLSSPPMSTPASPALPAVSSAAFPERHGRQVLSPIYTDNRRYRHKSNEN